MDKNLADLERLGESALGPCACCDRVMLDTGFPLFFRAKVNRCGIDAQEVRRHVGLAAAIAPGRDGLALASIMGPAVQPVVIMDTFEFNVCMECSKANTIEDAMLVAMAVAGR